MNVEMTNLRPALFRPRCIDSRDKQSLLHIIRHDRRAQ